MIIKLKLKVAKLIYANTNIIDRGYQNEQKLSKPSCAMDEVETFMIDLNGLSVLDIKKLRVKISEYVPNNIVEKIDRFIEASENPERDVIKSLDEFKAALIAYIKLQKTKWFWRMGNDNFMMPYIATEVVNVPRNRNHPRHIKLTLHYGSIGDGEGNSTNIEVGFYEFDLIKKDAMIATESSSYFDVDEADLKDESEDEEVVVVKTKGSDKKSKPYLPLRTILLNKNIFYTTEKLQKDYVEQYELWKKVQLEQVGKQFISNGLGFGATKSYWGSGIVSFIEDKKNCKLVVEEFTMKDNGNGFPITYSCKMFGYQYLPYHLYVKLYDITKHRDVKCHISGLIEYVYNKKLLDELIVEDGVKGLINCLVDGKIEMEGKDIIEGKSGGLVILGYGPPGNGKTLTGEIYSEYVEKPLYQIQSSQLGLSITDIETKLKEILRRSERWGCILMIDEADTYIFKRGDNMLQNAIVGTFLRLLEYYNGILFLTTNRKDIIDDAIMSRVTLAISYQNPSTDNLIKIWETHIPSFGVNLPKKNIKAIAEKFPMSGRDVRNTLKLLSKYYKQEEITAESIEFVKQYLPSYE